MIIEDGEVISGKDDYSDEEIEKDYVIAYGVVIKVMMFNKETLYFVNGTKAKREECKKIILTTDKELIKDGVQAIDDDFLEWFVKNPSCEEVETVKGLMKLNDDGQEYGFPDMSNVNHPGAPNIPPPMSTLGRVKRSHSLATRSCMYLSLRGIG